MPKLWIMRHGEAEWHASSDLERALSANGVREVQSVAKKLDLPTSIQVWHSPYLRAKQTCSELTNIASVPQEQVREEPMITPEGDVKNVASLIEAVELSELMLVSHMPLVAKLVRELSGDDRIGGFQTAQIVELSFDAEAKKWALSAIYAPSKD
ncbi:MAG: phosphohistidine phosphatase SixA [Gammaproteobacteria bacterium]|nr:phosphohistidine phosphatase SixA [Gammaproteobacteria bacterium]